MTPPTTPSKFGKNMAWITWIIGIFLLTQFFGMWEEDQYNPNRNPSSTTGTDSNTLILRQNRQGHYLVNGLINKQPATFILDTGATNVLVPQGLANTYNLDNYGDGTAMTANGMVGISRTKINELSIGTIKLYNVDAAFTEGMSKDMPVLLGMSVLKDLEMIQKGDELLLRQRY